MNLQINHRKEFPDLLNRLNLEGTGVEVGSQNGAFAEVILKDSKLKRLFCVDCWEYQSLGYKDKANVAQNIQNIRYLTTVTTVMPYGMRAVVLKMYSEQASNLFELESLDFVYIDANHQYEYAYEDINIWYYLVKSGGILSGHDYLNVDRKDLKCGVKDAVDAFIAVKGHKLYITKEEYPSWYIIK